MGIVSLGCPKALVDSERILTRPRAEGYALLPSYDGTDVVIVNACGFPGETEEDFQALLGWLGGARLDRVGCFRYEPVEGATANDLAHAVPEAVKEERWHRLMDLQRSISADRQRAKVGRRLPVLIDAVDAQGATGRSPADAPEIDGAVFLDGETGLRPGDLVSVTIEEADDYDLWGRLADPA